MLLSPVIPLDLGKRSGGNVDLLIQSRSMDERIIQLQEANDNVLLLSQVMGVKATDTKLYHETMKSNPFLVKGTGLDSGTSGSGSDWVPTGYSTRLFDRIRLELMVAALHESIIMPTAIYKPPIISTDSTGYLIAENAGADDAVTSANLIPATKPGTSNFTLTAKKLGGRVVFSEELSEDSITPVLPLLSSNIVIALSSSIENAIINGDTDGTHQDSDVTAATDARKAWDGYRKCCQSAAKVSLATFNGDTIASIRTKMGRYAIKPSNLAWVVGMSGYNQLMNVRDSQNNTLVTTLDKYGAGATILTGELGKLYGIPIIVSEYVRETLNSSGVYDASTITKTIMLLVNRKAFIIGDRRQLKVKTAEEITTDQTVLVATIRKAFAPVYPVATNYAVGEGYNITA